VKRLFIQVGREAGERDGGQDQRDESSFLHQRPPPSTLMTVPVVKEAASLQR
jgi:hypothetical protein